MGLFSKRRAAEPDAQVVLAEGCEYWLTYSCRDIGYGDEEGCGYYAYIGPADAGKFEFLPAEGVPLSPIYLFPDEITSIALADEEAV